VEYGSEKQRGSGCLIQFPQSRKTFANSQGSCWAFEINADDVPIRAEITHVLHQRCMNLTKLMKSHDLRIVLRFSAERMLAFGAPKP
jgi:hypothetical protein